MRILFYGETPCIETGAARVNRHILDTIVEEGNTVEVLAMSHFMGEEYDHDRYPFPITSVDDGKHSGKMACHEHAKEMIEERAGTFDVLFISGDMHVPNILSTYVEKYPSIVYAAIDGEVHFKDQVGSLALATWPIVFSSFAYTQVRRLWPTIPLRRIGHGCEPDIFYPLPEEERRAYRAKAFGIDRDETFLVMWANRNQMRKDPARAMAAFHMFHVKHADSILYMHARMIDLGGNLASQAALLGLDTHPGRAEVIFSPPDYTEVAGFDRDKLNKMYNAADVCISTSQGEGWGLTTTEAMAAGTPFIGPANTTFFEILGEERGYLAESGGPNLWSIYYGTDDAPRPLTSVTNMAARLEYVYEYRYHAKERAKRARAWTQQHTWQMVKTEWRDLLREARSSINTSTIGSSTPAMV